MTYENTPITPAYFSTSNGYTEDSEDYWKNKVPYLRSVKSPWDKNTPKFMDQQIFALQEVEKKLGTDLPSIEQLSMEIARTDSNRVSKLTIGSDTYSGREVREALELRSSDFSIEKKNNHLIFTTKGFGHGIGMSQYGANGMAKEGKSYEKLSNITIKVSKSAPSMTPYQPLYPNKSGKRGSPPQRVMGFLAHLVPELRLHGFRPTKRVCKDSGNFHPGT